MPLYPPRYDELYVISDLHLGGQRDSAVTERVEQSLIKEGKRLGWFIDYVTRLDAKRQVALVLNGDIVDFLASKNAKTFDPAGAVDKLTGIIRDRTLTPVWTALQKLVRAENRTLVLVLGNHDIELALPPVIGALLQELCGDDAAARGRVRTVFDNEGFRCQVGGASVLCVHGNEIDDFNIVEHEGLRRAVVAMNRGLNVPEVRANAGSYLVVNILNEIKEAYPWVDLLKPELLAVVNLLLLIGDDVVRKKLRNIPKLMTRLLAGRAAVKQGQLGGMVQPDAPELPIGFDKLCRELLGASSSALPASEQTVELLFAQVEEDLINGLAPVDLASEQSQTLGGFSDFIQEVSGAIMYIKDRVTGKSREEAIRDAMQRWLVDDRSFALDQEDASFTALSAKGYAANFLIAGHTHLARALKRGENSYYYNSGTWSRLIELTPPMLKDKGRFSAILSAFQSRSLEALEEIPDLVSTRATVVWLRTDGGKTIGTLEMVTESQAGAFQLAEQGVERDRQGDARRKTCFVKE